MKRFRSNIILALSIIFILNNAFAQGIRDPNSNSQFNNNIDIFSLRKIDDLSTKNYSSDIKGTPFLYVGMQPCNVKTTKEGVSFTTTCNYDLVKDEFIVKTDDGGFALNPAGIELISFSDRTFKPTSTFGSMDKSYVEVINESPDLSILETHKSEVKEKYANTLGLIQLEFHPTSQVYLYKDNELTKLPNSNKKILAILPAKYSNADTKGYNLKNTDDLKRFLRNNK